MARKSTPDYDDGTTRIGVVNGPIHTGVGSQHIHVSGSGTQVNTRHADASWTTEWIPEEDED